MVYYRKYRPQTIAELDSTKVRETLTAVLSREDIPHAFLLTGPKGLGKTSTARIIAKVVNCENRKKGIVEPCNTCESCVSITNGTNIDVLEIDGASNRGIDEIRDLRDKVKLAPSRAKKKVYIIDEVHMLTTEAFNALLKTIEEPPSHVMFLFATTEPHKVPDTILSRCFHVAYTLATEDDLVRSFERIVKGEKIDIDTDALHMVARMADGGFRDGTKILEELVSLSNGEKITKDFIEQNYQLSKASMLATEFKIAIWDKDAKKALEVIKVILENGIDLKYFLSKFLRELNIDLLTNVGVEENNMREIIFPSEDVRSLVILFSQAYQDTKYAIIPQLPLELAVVEWCSVEQNAPVILGSETTPESILRQAQGIKDPGQARMTIDTQHTMDSLLKKEKNMKVQAVLRGDKEEKVVVKKSDDPNQEKLSEKQVAERLMDNLIFKVKPYNHSVAGVLRGCRIMSLVDGKVVFETAYKFHKEKLDEVKTKHVLEQALKEITGKELKVMIELKEK